MDAKYLALVQMAVGGGVMGMAYALVAYGFQLTYAAGKAVNFGQGELVMLGAFAGITLTGIGLPCCTGGDGYRGAPWMVY